MGTVMRVVGFFVLAIGLVAMLDALDVFHAPRPLVRWALHRDSLIAWTYRAGTMALGGALLFLTPHGDER